MKKKRKPHRFTKKANSSNKPSAPAPAAKPPRAPYVHSPEFIEKVEVRQARVLAALRMTNGRPMAAATLAKVSIDTILDWRATDKVFCGAYLKALDIVPLVALDEAIRRGIEGFEGRPMVVEVYDAKLKKNVKRLLPIREYSDAMLARLLAATDKRFRAGVKVDVDDPNDKLVVKVTRYA